ncbi:MAG TPA: hypothetical protein VMY87_11850 [Armatimonadota bacterium]|nr:hypothetical protein [Armatimonadota bacterium]
MSTLRVAIAGIRRGQHFAEALRWCRHTEVTAICDIDSARLDAVRRRDRN